jgi:hypothetical protein
MKTLLILLFLCGIAHSQTLRVKLKAGSLYYNSMYAATNNGTRAHKNDVFILVQPLQKIGMFKAALKDKTVYVNIDDIVRTPQYRAYFNKYFFSPSLREWNTNEGKQDALNHN